jgi:prepilin-type N-terminal cleavage/methylation domain-containing protein
MGNQHASRRGERGFTMIEVMIAATVLVVGVLATFQLIDTASGATARNSARLGAQGLAREIVEYARATDYDKLQPLTLETALRQRPSLTGTASPWKITRRGVTYTVTDTVCTFDDPKDGLASTPPSNACPAAAAVNTIVDANPDDFRRVTINLSWKIRGLAAKMTQSALIVNPAGALGPRITRFDDPGNVDQTAASISWGSGTLQSSSAAGVHWNVDDGISQGDATGGPTSWAFTWQLGVPKLSPLTLDGTWVPDGNYTIQAQAVDGRGVPGEARDVVVHINRHPAAQVSGLAGGYNARFGGVVDLHWQRYGERDVVGYRVYRDGSTLVCPSSGSGYITGVTCTDANPGGSAGSSHTYTVKAVDCNPLWSATCNRDGAATDLPVTLTAGAAPLPVVAVTATIVDGLPKLSWLGVPGAQFYRIYRDTGTGLSDRYDETITSDPTYTDPHPGNTTQHTYWVTAVGSSFNESAASPPVTSPGS